MLRTKSPIPSYTGDSLLFNEQTENDMEFFSENLDQSKEYKTLPDFLEFHSSFPRSGKQGILGLLTNVDTNKKYVYKISQNLNFLVDQEHSVMDGLNRIREYCPHFCKTFGKFKTKIVQNYREEDNPFDVEDREDTVLSDVLLMENIDNGRKFYRYIKNDQFTEDMAMSIVKQTLLADIVAGEHLQFTHYDIHSNNVLVKKCPANSVFLYILDENRTYLVPTYGYYPIIIDFGFSFNKNCEERPMYGALAHTDIGFIPSVYDQHSDAKLFLTSVSSEMKKYKKSEVSNVFRDLITNIYKKCNVDLECGWDTREDEISISDQLLKKMNNQFRRSKFFKKQGHHIVDLLQTLVDLPLTNRKTDDNIEDLSGLLVTEFLKIEKDISEDFYNMYIMKNIVEAAALYKNDYLTREKRSEAVYRFKNHVLKSIDEVVKFCNPKINWEKLLCCLLCMSKCIENFCHDRLKKLLSVKKADYNKMLLKNTSEIYEAIEANVPSHFYFEDTTDLYVWDCVQKKSYKMKIHPDMVDKLNRTHPFERGTVLYEYISSKNY
jgi:hypothetical protein